MKNEIVKKEKYTRYKVAHYQSRKGQKDGYIRYCNASDKLYCFDFRYDMAQPANSKWRANYQPLWVLKKKGDNFQVFNFQPRNISNQVFPDMQRKVYKKGVKGYKQVDWQAANRRFMRSVNAYLEQYNLRFPLHYKPHRALRELCYPTVSDWFDVNNELVLQRIPSSVSGDLRKAKDFKHLLRLAYNNDGKMVTRLSLKAIENNAIIPKLVLGRTFKNIAPLGHIQERLKLEEEDANMKFQPYNFVKPFRVLLRECRPQEVKKLILDQNFIHPYRLQDTINLFHNGSKMPDRFDDLKDLHDRLSDNMYEVRQKIQKITKQKVDALDGKIIDDLKLITPKSNKELQQWGKDLHNCLGGYFSSIQSGSIQIIGVEKRGTLKYALSIRGKTLEQFYGPCNELVPHEDFKPIIKFLRDEDVINNNNYDRFCEELREASRVLY